MQVRNGTHRLLRTGCTHGAGVQFFHASLQILHLAHGAHSRTYKPQSALHDLVLSMGGWVN